MLLLKIIFFIIVIVAFIYSLLTHFILVFELRTAAVEQQTPLPFSWPHILKSFAAEYLCTIFNILLYPFRYGTSKCPSVENTGTLTPILFVHGYLHNQIAWFWFIRQLQKKIGIRTIYSVNLTPPFAAIADLASLLQKKIEDIKRETGATQVILIGHSMGGLASAYFTEYLANPNEVATVITLGTPFKGTKLAVLGYGQNAAEMVPNSHFLTELTHRIQKSAVPYCSVASKIDNIVIPWQSALLAGEKNKNLVLEDHGHLRLLLSPIIIEQVAQWVSP